MPLSALAQSLTVRPPCFNLCRSTWSALNGFRTEHASCAADMHKWRMAMASSNLRQCQTPSKTQTDKETNWQTSIRHQESNLVHFSLKIWHLVAIILLIFLTINWPNFVYLLVNPGFLTPDPVNFYEASRFVPLIGWTLLTDTTYKRTCLFVRVCFRWSLTHTCKLLATLWSTVP